MNQKPVGEHRFGQHHDGTLKLPWWRVSVMWVFFVGGLGGVVLASFALLATAVAHRDTVMPHDAQAPRMGTTPSVPNTPTSPAMQARNHAATPAR
jgi:uncharacterized protein